VLAFAATVTFSTAAAPRSLVMTKSPRIRRKKLHAVGNSCAVVGGKQGRAVNVTTLIVSTYMCPVFV
jgi:hypothetical protein